MQIKLRTVRSVLVLLGVLSLGACAPVPERLLIGYPDAADDAKTHVYPSVSDVRQRAELEDYASRVAEAISAAEAEKRDTSEATYSQAKAVTELEEGNFDDAERDLKRAEEALKPPAVALVEPENPAP